MSRRSVAAAAVLLLCAAGALPLQAQVLHEGFAEVRGLSFAAGDLAPADGIAPTLEFTRPGTFFEMRRIGDGLDQRSDSVTREGAFRPHRETLGFRDSSTTASAGADGARVEGRSSGLFAHFDTHLFAALDGIRLGPRTSLQVTGTSELAIRCTPLPGAADCRLVPPAPLASNWMTLGFEGAPWEERATFGATATAGDLPGSFNDTVRRTGPFVLRVENDSDHFRTAGFTLSMSVVSGNISPIPEPGTSLLTGLGLAAIGLLGRRRPGPAASPRRTDRPPRGKG